MKSLKIWGVVLCSLFALSSCDGELAKPAASGRPYEMMVVVDDSLWQRLAGRALFDVLDTDLPGLPQPERSFRISQTDPKRFNQILNIFRNIIIVDINDKEYTQTKMRYVRDEYARSQVILRIQSPNEKEFAEFVTKNTDRIIDFFVRIEMNRLVKQLKTKHSILDFI